MATIAACHAALNHLQSELATAWAGRAFSIPQVHHIRARIRLQAHSFASYEANRDQIRDPDLIYPGQVFMVPTVN